MIASMVMILALCVYAIVIVYQDRMGRLRPTSHETFAAATAQARANT